MIAHVVPVVRLRRATTWWSYKIPPHTHCLPGSLVRIPFRGRLHQGVVWDIVTEDKDAKASIDTVLSRTPLVRRPSRDTLEWMAQAGCTSLSSALHAWLPAALRKDRLTRTTLGFLADFDTWQEKARTSDLTEQRLFLVPGHRPRVRSVLIKQYGDSFADTFLPASEQDEIRQWFSIAKGEMSVVYGRERALFSPFLNLRQVVVQEIEDISYFHEQTPYLSMVEVASVTAKHYNASYEPRSWLPRISAESLWGGSVRYNPKSPGDIELIYLRREPLLNERLIARIQQTLDQGQSVAILYNAHDRKYSTEEGENVILPGTETLQRSLRRMLTDDPGERLVFGTRTLLADPPQNIGLAILLSLDPLLRQSVFADTVHGWTDITRMASLGAPCLIQCHDHDHPLVHALRNSLLDEYCMKKIEERKNFGLPPFGTTYACTLTMGNGSAAKDEKAALFEQDALRLASDLQHLLEDNETWKCSHPAKTSARGKDVLSVFVHSKEQNRRLPTNVYSALASLKRPWKVTRNPWYLL